jgi:hypothetical protein
MSLTVEREINVERSKIYRAQNMTGIKQTQCDREKLTTEMCDAPKIYSTLENGATVGNEKNSHRVKRRESIIYET